MSYARPSSMGLGLFFVSMMISRVDRAQFHTVYLTYKHSLNRKLQMREGAYESILAKTYHIGRGIYFMTQMVYER